MPLNRSLVTVASAAAIALIPAGVAAAAPITPDGVEYDPNAFALDLNQRNDALVAVTRSDGGVEVLRRRGARGPFGSPLAVGRGRVVAAQLGERRGQAIVLYTRRGRLYEAALTRRGWVEAALPRALTKNTLLLDVGYSGRRLVAVVQVTLPAALRVLVRARSGAWTLARKRALPTRNGVIAAVSEGSGNVAAAWVSSGTKAQVAVSVFRLANRKFSPVMGVFDRTFAAQTVRPLDITLNARGESAVVARLAGGAYAAYGYGNSYRQILRLRPNGTLSGRSGAVSTDALSLARAGRVLTAQTNAGEAPYDPARDIIRYVAFSTQRQLNPEMPLTVFSAERDDVTLLDGLNGIETTTRGLSVVWWNNDPGPGPDDVRYSFLRNGARAFTRPVRTAGSSRGASRVAVGRSRALLVLVDDASGSGRVTATPIG